MMVSGLVAAALLLAPCVTEEETIIRLGPHLAVPGEAAKAETVLVVRDGRIKETRPVEEGELDFAVDVGDLFVIPGLIDCHTHLSGEMSKDSRLNGVLDSEADVAIRATVFARRTLEAGFTSVRNVGSDGDVLFALRDAIAMGTVPGPRIQAAGQSITPTGGHGDGTHGYREDLFDMPGVSQGVADGPVECRRAVRMQVKRGADVIKITATGGVLSNTNAGTDQQFFDDELQAIVQAAHGLGRKVAAHAHGTAGIAAALRAGVDSIEHGSYLDAECVALFLETGAYLVPTMLAGETVVEKAREEGYFTPAVAAKARLVGPMMRGAVMQAHQAGVLIAFGTDSGVSRHGDNAREFDLMVDAGMTPEETLISATVHAAALLGWSDRVGTLEPGKFADFVAYRSDPREDVSTLHAPVLVVQGGEVKYDAR